MSAKKKVSSKTFSIWGKHKKKEGDEFNFNQKKEEQKGALLLEGAERKFTHFVRARKEEEYKKISRWKKKRNSWMGGNLSYIHMRQERMKEKKNWKTSLLKMRMKMKRGRGGGEGCFYYCEMGTTFTCIKNVYLFLST